jgi:hypothetical protein
MPYRNKAQRTGVTSIKAALERPSGSSQRIA